jgi:probable FeS assembly SUF system protein SufT
MMAMQEQNTQENELIDESNIILKRDCNAILIPNGIPITMIAGEKVSIMQKLGGSFTIYYNGNLARVDGRDADAIGFEIPQELVAAIRKVEKTIVGNGFVSEDEVWEQLRTCYDPEIPVNIVDLGLIYECDIFPLESEGNRVEIKMTLTAAGCGMGPIIVEDVHNKVLAVNNVFEVKVDLVWDPAWNQDMMSEEAKLTLGLL